MCAKDLIRNVSNHFSSILNEIMLNDTKFDEKFLVKKNSIKIDKFCPRSTTFRSGR
jgi:hypothetical protein